MITEEALLLTGRTAFGPIFDSDLVAIGCWQGPGLITDANEKLLALLGRTRADLARGLDWATIVGPDASLSLQRARVELSERGSTTPCELMFVRPDGGAVPVLFGAAIYDGRPDAGVFFVVDIGDRKYQEQSHAFLSEAGKLLASSLDFEETLEQVARMAVPAYADWCFVDVIEADESVTRLVVAHADPADAARADALRRRRHGFDVIQTREPERVTGLDRDSFLRIARGEKALKGLRGLDALADASIRSYMTVPMIARQLCVGAITFANTRWDYDERSLHCAQELAQRAALAIDNARLYREARAAVRTRDEFVSIASHELKTPLTSLQLSVQFLGRTLARTATAIEPRVTEVLARIHRQIQRLDQLTHELLDVAQFTAGRLQISVELLDLALLVREVSLRFESEFERSSAPLSIESPPSVLGEFDRARCDQVITNLLSNALKYGAGKPVLLRLAATEATVTVTVRDHGIGINDADQARIFERFERAVSQQHYGGLGLGLWIAHSAVVAMGGSVRVDSALGSGSEFQVKIPRWSSSRQGRQS